MNTNSFQESIVEKVGVIALMVAAALTVLAQFALLM
jgi:hypothetical protein